MNQKKVIGYWDSSIPIQIDRVNPENVKKFTDYQLSLDGTQFALIGHKHYHDVIIIYNLSDFQPIKQIIVPNTHVENYQQEIVFSSEYLMFSRKSAYGCEGELDLFIHNYQRGQNLFFKNAQLIKSFYSSNVYYLVLELVSFQIQLFKIDEDFQIKQLGQFNGKGKTALEQNNIGFYLKFQGRLIFLSKYSLKILRSFTCYINYSIFTFNFQQNLIFIKNNRQTKVLSMNNNKIIRKLGHTEFGIHKSFTGCLYKNYVIICINNRFLFVQDIKEGKVVGEIEFQGYTEIYNLSIWDGFLVFEGYRSNFGWKLN